MTPALLDPNRIARATADRLDPDRAGSSKKIKHPGAGQACGQHGKQRAAYTVLSGSHPVSGGNLDSPPTHFTARDAHAESIPPRRSCGNARETLLHLNSLRRADRAAGVAAGAFRLVNFVALVRTKGNGIHRTDLDTLGASNAFFGDGIPNKRLALG